MWFIGSRARHIRSVEAEIRYLRDALVRPCVDAAQPAKSMVSSAAHRVQVHDMRAAPVAPLLGREGFELIQHHSTVSDFSDARQHPLYCQEVEKLMHQITGSSLVFLSPSVVLRSRTHPRYMQGVIADNIAGMPHSDRTDRSVWTEARGTLQHYGIEELPPGRLMAYNIWRVLTPPPQDYPLAFCELRTVREQHLVRADSRGNAAGSSPTVEFYLLLFDAGHRWCYFSGLTRDEVLVFQQFDSAASGPSGCPHTAFHDPAGYSAPVTRMSVEVRAYVFMPA